MLLTLLTTDGIFERVTYPDNPVSRSAFTTERNLDAQYPKERLRATQAARERAGIFGPTGTVPRNAVAAGTGAETQEVGGAPPLDLDRPLRVGLADLPL
jgi:hypothetical protein